DESPEVERIVEAISAGDPIEWERAAETDQLDAETLKSLRLIDTVSRLHRSGGAMQADFASSEPVAERSWGHLGIRAVLGGGAYGEVYRAYDPGLQIEVALKLWDATEQPRTIEQLLEEARQLARVRHPNVLRVLGVAVNDGRAGMWTELLEGATL